MLHTVLQLDRNAFLWINRHHYWWLDAILAPVAYAGECAAIWIVVCLALLIFGKSKHRKTALLLIATMLVVDRLIAAQAAHFFDRTRPYLALHGVRHMGICWTSGSFPSGHAHSVWIAAIILSSRWRNLTIPLAVFAALTCYSRPYFGMHYPLDTAAGALLGITAGFSVLGMESLLRKKRKRDRQAAPTTLEP